MAIYFVRHGESQANLDEVFAGSGDDSPLTELGRQQAKSAAADLEGVKVDRIISSPLSRAKDTAGIIAREIRYLSDIKVDDRIREYNLGELAGRSVYPKRTSEELVSAQGAEDPKLFLERIRSFLLDYKNAKGNILMVCHAGIGRMIEADRIGLDPSSFYEQDAPPNAHVIKLDLGWLN